MRKMTHANRRVGAWGISNFDLCLIVSKARRFRRIPLAGSGYEYRQEDGKRAYLMDSKRPNSSEYIKNLRLKLRGEAREADLVCLRVRFSESSYAVTF